MSDEEQIKQDVDYVKKWIHIIIGAAMAIAFMVTTTVAIISIRGGI